MAHFCKKDRSVFLNQVIAVEEGAVGWRRLVQACSLRVARLCLPLIPAADAGSLRRLLLQT